jgi:hypothetical protein
MPGNVQQGKECHLPVSDTCLLNYVNHTDEWDAMLIHSRNGLFMHGRWLLSVLVSLTPVHNGVCVLLAMHFKV